MVAGLRRWRREPQGIRPTAGERIFDALNTALLLVLVVVTLYPLYYVLIASLSDPKLLEAHTGVLLWPVGFSLEAYQRVWSNPDIRVGYFNTLVYVLGGTAMNVALTILGAYALSRRNLPGQTPILLAIVFTMFFSAGLIPVYLIVREMGLLDTRWAVVLPSAISAWNLMILRTSFLEVPSAYDEAARIDGASDWALLTRVYVPMNLAPIAVITLFYAVGHWNSYFDAMIYLSNRDLFPLQLFLREILVGSQTDSMSMGTGGADRAPLAASLKYATIITSTLPILLVYPFLQRYFVKGVMVGGIKE